MTKTEFIPGDEANGVITLSCDKKLKCKRFRVIIEGQLTVKSKSIGTIGIVVPVSYDTITQTHIIHHEEKLIAQEVAFDPGSQKFVFQFKIPEDAELSYEGHNGKISYEVEAIMDLPWRTYISTKSPITIFEYIDDFPDEVTREVLNHEGEDILEVEIDSQKYCIGDKITFRYRVNTDMKFNNLRARIEHIEKSIYEGKWPNPYAGVLWEEKIPSEDVIRYEWKSWTFNIDKPFPPWIKHENLKSSLILKLTLDRSFKFDKSVKIELISGHCSKNAAHLESGVSTPVKVESYDAKYYYNPEQGYYLSVNRITPLKRIELLYLA